ncbi:unnamed protein product, partial [Sphagnum jensenii]
MSISTIRSAYYSTFFRLQSAHGLERGLEQLEHEVRGGGCDLRGKRRSKATSWRGGSWQANSGFCCSDGEHSIV